LALDEVGFRDQRSPFDTFDKLRASVLRPGGLMVANLGLILGDRYAGGYRTQVGRHILGENVSAAVGVSVALVRMAAVSGADLYCDGQL
jgi:hypothetical protein